ncbi:hypothetical protein P7K49_002623 [Saguinus oedipus]|uniref:Calcineurin binding protein 1 n=1 Tax=Saguinus oedipus TaxID=9490 RepID=A0ABQ9WLU0_SAGOE|nr:hypothetical protein P7K49_002623 [Saguinus oedipus]
MSPRLLPQPVPSIPQGIWRIPVDEIDRPGSFAWHMNRSIVLLLKVLAQLRDHGTLLKVSSMLQRTPDQGKKYLRDADRQVLAQRAFILTVKVLEDTLTELAEVPSHKMPRATQSSHHGVEEELDSTAPTQPRPVIQEQHHLQSPISPLLPGNVVGQPEGSERPGPKVCGLPGARMTTDVSHKATPEEGQEGLPQPKKPPLTDGSGPGPEPGGKVGLLNHRPVAMDAGDSADQIGERKDKESPRAGPTEPMDTGEATIRHSDLERTAPLLPGRPPRDRGPESRPTELSLEELSISARQQPTLLTPAQPAPAPATTMGTRGGGHPEEPLPRLSRKRKLLEDTESGKTLLLDAYRVWQQGQKGVAYDLGRVERIMSETYMLIKQVDEEAALEQAVKFCQVHLGAAAQRQLGLRGDEQRVAEPPANGHGGQSLGQAPDPSSDMLRSLLTSATFSVTRKMVPSQLTSAGKAILFGTEREKPSGQEGQGPPPGGTYRPETWGKCPRSRQKPGEGTGRAKDLGQVTGTGKRLGQVRAIARKESVPRGQLVRGSPSRELVAALRVQTGFLSVEWGLRPPPPAWAIGCLLLGDDRPGSSSPIPGCGGEWREGGLNNTQTCLLLLRPWCGGGAPWYLPRALSSHFPPRTPTLGPEKMPLWGLAAILWSSPPSSPILEAIFCHLNPLLLLLRECPFCSRHVPVAMAALNPPGGHSGRCYDTTGTTAAHGARETGLSSCPTLPQDGLPTAQGWAPEHQPGALPRYPVHGRVHRCLS